MGTRGGLLSPLERERVSIQLMSPASGNIDIQTPTNRVVLLFKDVSIQLMSPASGNFQSVEEAAEGWICLFGFPFN